MLRPPLSVCPMSDPNLRMEGHRKLKFGTRETQDMGDSGLHLEDKVKVTKPLERNFGTNA